MWRLFSNRKPLNKPSRPNRHQHKRSHATQRRLQGSLESLEARALMAADVCADPPSEIFVAPTGDDWNDGSATQPFATLRRALDAARPCDTITLRNGVYEGGINIDIDQLTIRSAPGEWAVIESPLTPFGDGHAESVIRYGFDVEGGRLENLEIQGGYHYGVMFWDWWEPTWEEGTTHLGASGITLDGVKVHDTGADAIKITPGADDITIINSEIYNAGRRTRTSADGIDNNNGDRMTARGNYIHDIPGIGILTAGGTIDSLIEQNLIQRTEGAGIVVGFYSELEWLDPQANPNYYASINTIARNNIVVDAGEAGIGIYGAYQPQVYHNTLVNPAANAQAPIQFGGYDMWVSDSLPYHHATSVDPMVMNNIITTESTNRTRMVDIREGSISGQLTLDYNLYHATSTRGILFIDRNTTGDGTPEQTFGEWGTRGYDAHSILGDPLLDESWHLTANSPAIGAAFSSTAAIDDFSVLPNAGQLRDYDGALRFVDPPEPDFGLGQHQSQFDLGADEFSAGPAVATPPAPFGAPSLELDARAYHDFEGHQVVVQVVRSGSLADSLTVQYSTVAGTAEPNSDFTPISGMLHFTAGQDRLELVVPLLSDNEAEGDEHFLITLTNAITDGTYPVRLGHQHTSSITIDDAQTPPIVHYSTKWVSNAGSDVTGDGSEDHPWHSLQHAADNVQPGDIVLVMPGEYWGFQVSTDGKPDARITFLALPGVTIDTPNPENNLDGINLEDSSFVTIDGFSVAGMPRAGIRSVNNDGVILRNNHSDANGYWGILTGWSENIIVENNVTTNSVREHGIYISNSADGAIIRNNVVWGNHSSGIQFNADRYLPGDGVHSNNLVEGNIIFENGTGGGSALNFDGVQDSTIRNNLLYNNHSTGIVLYSGFAADASKNNILANNTVVMADDARWALLLADGSSGNTLVNNIFLNKNPNRGSVTVESNSLPAWSDHNLVQDLVQVDGANGPFANWLGLVGEEMDQHTVVIPQSSVLTELDNLFVNPTAGDFHLKAGGQAIDAGGALHAPPTDLFGHLRPAGECVDLGAFEFGWSAADINIHFEAANFVGYESVGMAEITVVREGDTEAPLAVLVNATPGTADSSDFSPVGGWLVFQPGQSRRTFRVFLHDDALLEGRETINFSLTAVGDPTALIPADQTEAATGLIPTDQVGDPTGLLPTDQTTLSIVSEDAWQPGSFEFAEKAISVNESAGLITITVHRSGGNSGDAAVHYTTDLFVRPKQATWIKRHTDLLYPTDSDTAATAGDDYTPVSGWLNFADGETTKTLSIPILDDLWFESGEAFVVRLSDPTGGATLAARSQLKVHIDSEDAPLPGTFEFTAASYDVTEGTAERLVTIQRSGGGNMVAAVQLYHTGAGNGVTTNSAWAPGDYGSVPTLVEFAPGEMSKTIAIPIVDDSATETDEAFSIQLFSPTAGASMGTVAQTTVTIHDNESTFYFQAPQGAWSFQSVEGTGSMPITVVRQGALGTPASIRVKTSDWGSATANVDFTSTDVTLQFAPGEASKTVLVPVLNDSLQETSESFGVSMSEAVGAQQGSWTWSANIVDDDQAASPGQLSFNSASFSVSEGGGQLIVTVTRSGGSDGAVTVQFETSDGASNANWNAYAWAGSNYGGTAGTLSFAPGETTKSFQVPIYDNTSVSVNKVFTVKLKNAAGGASLGAVTKAVVTIVENDSAIEFGTSSYVVNENAGYVAITIVRKGSSAGTASVDLLLSGWGASAGTDYLPLATPKVTFADGEYSKQVQIAIVDDLLAESSEWFGLSLANAVGSSLGSSLWGNVKIQDNE